MGTNKISKEVISFSLNETTKPRFNANQIQIDVSKRIVDAGIPKPTHKLVVGRSGKIGYAK